MPKVGISRLGVSLRSVVSGARVLGAEDILVQSCCSRAAECRTGDLYVALVDDQHDGHLMVEQAIAAGARAVLVERMVPTHVPQCVVADTRQAYAQLCQALSGHPSEHLALVGVTGSHGKTSIVQLLESVLAAAGNRVGSISTLGAAVSGRPLFSEPMVWTPPQLAFHLSRQVLEECTHAVVELPSSCLANHRAAGLGLDVAIISNIRRPRQRRFGGPANYQRITTRILNLLKPTGIAVINADDPICHQLLSELTVPCLTYGVKQDANVRGEILEHSWGEQVVMITAGDDSVVIRTSQTGKQFLDHCLAATAAGLALGLRLTEVARGIEQCHIIPGRMQTIQCGQAFGVMVDAAETADQLAVLLKTARHSTQGRTICVCTAPGSQSEEERYHLGKVAERGATQVVLTGENIVCGEIDYEPFHQVLDGMQRPGRAQIIPDRIRAIEWALEQAEPGDTVLITGRGHQAMAAIGAAPAPETADWRVTDVDVCQAWLYERLPTREVMDGQADAIYYIDDYR